MSTLTTENLLKIGEVATLCNLPVKTIRYYEEFGLLTPTVSRSETNYRLFEASVLDRLAFIKRGQSLGLSLHEIQEILDVHDQGHIPCHDLKQSLQKKVQQINEQIEALQGLRSQLLGVLSGWQDEPSSELAEQTICPNLATTLPPTI